MIVTLDPALNSAEFQDCETLQLITSWAPELAQKSADFFTVKRSSLLHHTNHYNETRSYFKNCRIPRLLNSLSYYAVEQQQRISI
jgi:hypothetical protein